jgi:CRP-like cAMP-binding protein
MSHDHLPGDFFMILLEELEKVQFVRNLGTSHLSDLARIATLKECAAGTVLFEEGQDSPVIYCVLRGVVSLQVEEPFGESVEIDTVGPGELLGWSPLFGRHSMTASAHATTECRLAVFEVNRFVELFERDPRFGLALLRQVGLQVSERLRSTRRALALVRTLTHHSPYALRHEGSD